MTGLESSEAIRQTLASPCDCKRRGCKECARARYHDIRARLDGTEFVYECYSSEDELLYIGRTNYPRNRIYTHRQEKDWWPEVVRVKWMQVPDVERQLIISKGPKYNKHGRR
jgi:hypothetical protein